MSTVFPYYNTHKYTWTSPDRQIYNQIEHILIEKRQLSNIVDVPSFQEADCDTDH
jgi:hypothetical protein